MKFLIKILQFWKSIIVTACILYLSFAPPSTFKGIPSFECEDKLVHFFMYFGLTCVLIFDVKRIYKKLMTLPRIYMILCILFPIILGGLVEIFQPMYFERTASWFDWLADLLGAVAGWYFMKLAYKRLKLDKL